MLLFNLISFCLLSNCLASSSFFFDEEPEANQLPETKNHDLSGVRRIVTDPAVYSSTILGSFSDEKARKRFGNSSVFLMSINAFAVGRFDLYQKMLKFTKARDFVLRTKLPLDTLAFNELILIPHLTAGAVENPEFQTFLDSALTKIGAERLASQIASFSLNLPLIKFAERYFPKFVPKFPRLQALEFINKRYGLKLSDIRPAVQYYLSKGIPCPYLENHHGNAQFSEVVELLTKAAAPLSFSDRMTLTQDSINQYLTAAQPMNLACSFNCASTSDRTSLLQPDGSAMD